jgi:dihydrofolate reductase
MRKVTSYLFISLDGVVEAPDQWVRGDLYEDFPPLIAEMITEQDAVVLGRKTYDEWSGFWPGSTIEPFASFINNTPKYVVSKTLSSVDWSQSSLMARDLADEIAALKRQPGKTIGVHGSISLVQALLTAGLLDELKFTLIPAVVGHGRRLLSREGEPIQLTLDSTQATPSGLQCMVFRPLA